MPNVIVAFTMNTETGEYSIASNLADKSHVQALKIFQDLVIADQVAKAKADKAKADKDKPEKPAE